MRVNAACGFASGTGGETASGGPLTPTLQRLPAILSSTHPGDPTLTTRVVEQFHEAERYLAGGVSASTRVNRALGHPMYFDRAAGCRLWDLDGREYIDLCCSHGATLLGHGDERVKQAVLAAME